MCKVKKQKGELTSCKARTNTATFINQVAVFLIQKTTNDWELSYNEGYSWESLGVKATGAQGEKGATGASGEQGEKGDKGEVGTSGADGKDGKYGIDGMVVPTVLGGTALAAEIIYLAISLIKKKRLL